MSWRPDRTRGHGSTGCRATFAAATAALLTLLLASSASAATTLHVNAATGSDTGNCQSSPCKTIGYAVVQGRAVPDLITIQVAAGAYAEDVQLGAMDSGLTITGAGSGTNPATSTVVTGSAPAATFATGGGLLGSASSVALEHLRIVNPAADPNDAIDAPSSDLALSDVAVDVQGAGFGVSGSNGDVSVIGGSITLENPAGGGFGLAASNGTVTVSGSPIDVRGNGFGISVGGGPLSVTNSPVTLESTTGGGFGIAASGGSLTISGSPVDVRGNGFGISSATGPTTVTSSPVTLESTTGGGFGVASSGVLTLSGSPVDVRGLGFGVSASGGPTTLANSPVTLESTTAGGFGIASSGALSADHSSVDVKGLGIGIANANAPATLSNLTVTLENASSVSAAISLSGRGSSVSHVTASNGGKGSVLNDVGSLSLADSSLTASAAATQPALSLSGAGTNGHTVAIKRSLVKIQTSTVPGMLALDVNLAVDSSELLGGSGFSFSADTGMVRTLTVVSSTVDAGILGNRDAAPVKSLIASSDNTVGTHALISVQGSILVEPPAAGRAGTNGDATVDCTHTEVPGTTQTEAGTLGAINCGTGSGANTSTASLSSIFASPGSSYALNPSWNGVDSVPESAISVPAPFSDSATDFAGQPRVLNGVGTCLPGTRDKGALELAGHGGVVPAPVIRVPSSVYARSTATFTGSAPNLPATVTPTFAWHSSDGASGTGVRFSHKFASAGRRTVSLTATGAAGCRASVSKTFIVHGIDVIKQLKLSPRSFRAASSGGPVARGSRGVILAKTIFGTVISYRGSDPARTTFTVLKLVRGKQVKVGSFSRTDSAGRVRFRFTGRLKGRRLAPGSYRLKIVPVNPAGKGHAVYARFQIKR